MRKTRNHGTKGGEESANEIEDGSQQVLEERGDWAEDRNDGIENGGDEVAEGFD